MYSLTDMKTNDPPIIHPSSEPYIYRYTTSQNQINYQKIKREKRLTYGDSFQLDFIGIFESNSISSVNGNNEYL